MTIAEPDALRSRWAIAVVGAGMVLTIVALVMAAATAQNRGRYSFEIESRSVVDGEVNWRIRLSIDGLPLITDERVIVPRRGKLTAIDEDGSVEWETRLGPVRRIEGAFSVVYALPDSGGGHSVAALDAASGKVLWRSEGSGFIASGRNFAVLADDDGLWMAAALTGERIADIERSQRRPDVGPDGVAYMDEGTLTIISADGPITKVTDLPASTAVRAVVAGAVITSERDRPTGRIVRAYDPISGDEMWMNRVSGLQSVRAESDALVVMTRSGGQLIDPRTGAILDTAAAEIWLQAPADGRPIAVVALTSERQPTDGSMRYFIGRGGTIAVEGASREVRWTRPSRHLIAVDDGIALLRYAGRHWVVATDTGETLAEIKGGKKRSSAIAAGRTLLVTEGKVQIVDSAGTSTDLANLNSSARIAALSADYAVVHYKGSRPRSRQIVAFDLASGAEIRLDREIDKFDVSWLSGTTLVLATGGGRITAEVDLASGTVSARADDHVPTKQVVAAFDAQRRRLLWTLEGQSGWEPQIIYRIDVVGSSVVISSSP